MPMLIAWIVLAALAIAAAGIIGCLIAKPIRSMLGANSYMAPAGSFYGRAFTVVVVLGVLAVVAGREPISSDAETPTEVMEYVWWVAEGLGGAFSSVAAFVAVFVLLLTILFAVLGRYRDQ